MAGESGSGQTSSPGVSAPAAPQRGLRTEAEVGVVHHRSADIDGVRMFYREAGPRDAPGVLLLHGFPTSSFQFRHLIPALSDRYHVVAPDYPGFGLSDSPDRGVFTYTFDALANKVERLVDVLGLSSCALYVFDYGAPVGFRLAERRPERVTALVIQNGNAYEEGLGEAWAPIRKYWADPSPTNREALREVFTLEALRSQYVSGEPDPTRLSPEAWTLDHLRISRPGNADVQLDLFYDYRNNVARYPRWQEYLRTHQPPALITWGANDAFFPVPGARAYLRDLKDAELHVLEAGHFALESHGEVITPLMRDFLDRKVGGAQTRH
ncbi:MAG: alpha/beta hydrolase [Myxococcaceae bacterium]|nr:alpha/beta hydrolase [Myxococcaceae bacterium]